MNNPPSSARLLEHFRAPKHRLPLHPLERAVLAAVAIHLCFLPWALGTMHVWSQVTSLVLAAMGLLLALIPRTYSGDYLPGGWPGQTPGLPQPTTVHPQVSLSAGGPAFRLYPWARLVRFPLFWIGLTLLAYIAVQGFNPSWVWERNATTWWLRRVNDIPWLPTSIDTPFERFNLWRQFIIYASAWLTVCTVWIGFTRRHALHILLTILVTNGVLFGLVGLYLRVTATTDTVFWLWKRVPFTTAFASFFYRNHAGAYLGLLAITATALAVWHYESGRRKMKKSTPAGLYIGGLGFFCLCVLFTYARGATFVLAGALLLTGIYLVWRFITNRGWLSLNPAITVTMALIFSGALALVVWQVDFGKATSRIESFMANRDQEASVHQRFLAYDAAYAMLQDTGLRGVGAGGFRFLFPEYVKRHPEIYRDGRFFWEHAHNDWLQIPIELGAGGCVLLLLGGVYWLAGMLRRRLWSHPLPFILLLGCLQTLAHAWIDFPFQNPAVLVTWCALLILAIRWTELESAP